MKRTSTLLFVAVAFLMLFSATRVGAAVSCDPERKEKGECFESKGYVVEVVKTEGNFPQIVSGNSVFTYKITRTNAKVKLVSHADILIPVCTPTLGSPISYSCSPVSCSGTMYSGGSGEPLTGFGLGLSTENTWKWNWLWPLKWPIGLPSGTGTVSLTLKGNLYASQNPMLIMVGLLKSEFPYGQILAPSCGQIPAETFPPQVPLATKKEEQIGDVKVCSETTDQSGCPTRVYSCPPAYSGPTCGCPNPVLWEQKPLSDISIVATTLQQVWTDPDPRCPATYIITSGSTCVKKCYKSGYCYVGPPGCIP